MDQYITYCFVLFMKQEVLPPTDGFIKRAQENQETKKETKEIKNIIVTSMTVGLLKKQE